MKGIRRMNKMRSLFRITSLLLCLLFSFELVSCSESSKNSGDKDEILEYFRDKLSETTPISSETVYWTKNGSVYHLFDNCRFLEKAEEVRHGTVAQSGRSRLCGDCAKRAESESLETDHTDDSSVPNSQSCTVTLDTVIPHPISPENPTESTREPYADTSAVIQEPDTTHIDSTVTPASGSPAPDNEAKTPATVYWTPNGSVWHSTADCPSLARSKTVNSGTVEQSGKSRGCKKCT